MNDKTNIGQIIEGRVDEIPLAGDAVTHPTVYVDMIKGAVAANGVARLNLVEIRVDSSTGKPMLKPVQSLAVPLAQLRSWASYLTKIADDNNAPPIEGSSDA